MSQATPALPKMTDLDYDPATRSHYVALPSCVDRSDAEGFRDLHGLSFKFHPNSGSWLQQRGLTAVPGITTRTQVIIVAHDLFEKLKALFYEWLPRLLAGKSRAAPNRRTRQAFA